MNYRASTSSCPRRIGIVGGGQLGRMLAFSAKSMGLTVTVTDPTPESPAGQVADKQIVGGYKDAETTRRLAAVSDVITVDAEFVNTEELQNLVNKGTPVHPSPETITTIKDKLLQKQFLRSHHIPTAAFLSVETTEDIEQAIKKFNLPLLLKARTDAYDGKGNFVIRKKSDIEKGLEKLKGRPLYVEKFVPFIKELAVMVARNTKGETKVYPVVETIHKDNICDTVIVPARATKHSTEKAKKLAIKTVEKLQGAGVFGIEMFLTKDGDVLINEIAPRVHNSGHYTTEACVTSQFEQHIRAICGLPLGSTDLVTKAAVMKNILGEKMGDGFPIGLEKALAISNTSIHIYGKKESRPGRKMGHITVIGGTIAECLKKAHKARKMLSI